MFARYVMRYIDVKKIFAHRIARNAGAVTIIQLVNYVTPLLVLVHLTKVLGVELYGVVASAWASCSYPSP